MEEEWLNMGMAHSMGGRHFPVALSVGRVKVVKKKKAVAAVLAWVVSLQLELLQNVK